MKLKGLIVINICLLIFIGCGKETTVLDDEINISSSTYTPRYSQELVIDTMPKDLIDTIVYEKLMMEHELIETQISVVGDIMFHNTQLFKAYDSESKTFSFRGIFEYVKPYLSTSDLTFGNLETTLHGPYGSETSASEYNYYGYSGYPRFNTPDSILDELLDTGFDFVSTANNHCLDRTYDGMINTIEKLDEAGIAHTGTFKSFEAREPYEIIEVNGIRFAVVNYTYSTNGLYLSDEFMPLVNNMELYREDLLENLYSDIELAEASDADFVIAMMHYGYEYQAFEDSRYQKPITYELIRRGADIVFGGHPHVMQPVEILTELDGETLDEPKVIIYSLGNFISSQRSINKLGGNTDLGVIFNVYIKTVDGLNPTITGLGFVPTYTLWQTEKIMTVPTNLDFEITDLVLADWDKNRIAFANEYTYKHLTTYIGESELISEPYEDNGVIRIDFKD